MTGIASSVLTDMEAASSYNNYRTVHSCGCLRPPSLNALQYASVLTYVEVPVRKQMINEMLSHAKDIYCSSVSAVGAIMGFALVHAGKDGELHVFAAILFSFMKFMTPVTIP